MKPVGIKGKVSSFQDKKNEINIKLSLYRIPPTWEISLEEFESTALKRLHLLQGIDEARSHIDVEGQLSLIIREYLKNTTEQEDILSHFTLRLSYSKQKEAERRWWIEQESSLLDWKIDKLCSTEGLHLSQVCDQLGLHFPRLSESEFEDVSKDLKSLSRFYKRKTKKRRRVGDTAPPSDHQLLASDFYLFPFEQVPHLLSNRSNVIIKGNVLVHRNQLLDIIIKLFKQHLKKSMEISSSSLSTSTTDINNNDDAAEDERVAPIIQHLSHIDYTSTTKDFNMNKMGVGISIHQLDELATHHYPLCMQHIHTSLRKHHKLKHTGRMQYGLFLKGLGITLEESLEFWKSEFTKVMLPKKFDSDYSYNIRHSYGKEGRGVSYSAYSCSKIIYDSSPQTSGEHAHGCPFKNWDSSSLTKHLKSLSFTPAQISEITSNVNQQQYQVACRVYYASKNEGSQEFVVNHPNQYFKKSYFVSNPPPAANQPTTMSGANNNNSNIDSRSN